MCRISVIVPIYKNPVNFDKCLESIINQSIKDIEIIIVSDGPKNIHQLCDEYAKKDNRIKVLKDIGKGLGGARNAGVKIAKGEYIAFVDSDDWVEQDTLKKALNVYENNDVDLVVFDTEFENNCKITQKRIDEENYISLKFEGLIDLNRDSIFNTNVHAWNKLWKKEIIDKYNIKFPDFVCFEDFPFYFKYVFASKKAYYLKEKLYVYNRRDNSSMAETYNKMCFKQNKVHITSCEFLYYELKNANLFEKSEPLFIELFDRWVSIALYHSKKRDRRRIKELAYNTIQKLDLDISQSPYLTKLKEKYSKPPIIRLLNQAKNIFRVDNLCGGLF